MSSPSPRGLFPAAYEAFSWLQDRRGLRRQRRRVAQSATGDVLEIGVGTGRNLPYYTRAARVVAIDPDPGMLGRAAGRAAEAPCPVELRTASGEALPFPGAAFETVVITLTLCTIADPGAALGEVHRVLGPAGRLVFLEHERSPNAGIARLQRRATPLWSRIGGGCRLDRPTVETIGAAGFRITHLWRSRDGRGSLVQGTAIPVPTGPS